MTVQPDISYLQAILLGFLQGLTEFLPVSSTAHMAIVPQLFFHMGDPGAAFSAVAQLGPIIAMIVYFWIDLKRYFVGVWRTKSPAKVGADDIDARLGWFTLIGTIPLLIFGFLLEHKIDTTFRSLKVIAWSLILLAFVLAYAEISGSRRRSLEKLTMRDAVTIGLAQVLALIPGTSRSGVTISVGLFSGLKREAATRFSFLLSIPAITAAGAYKLFKVLHHSGLGGNAGPDIVAAVVAGLFAFVVVKWFMGYVREHNTFVFVAYRIVLGVAILLLAHLGYIHNIKPPTSEEPTVAASAAAQIPSTHFVPTPDGHFVQDR